MSSNNNNKKSYQNTHFINPSFIHFSNYYFSRLSFFLTPKSQVPVFSGFGGGF